MTEPAPQLTAEELRLKQRISALPYEPYILFFTPTDAKALLATIDSLRTQLAILQDGRCTGCMEPVNPLHPKCACVRAQLAEAQEQLDSDVKGVLRIRCVEHRDVPQYNANEATGGECAACEAETLREAREFWDKSYPFEPKPGDQAWKLAWELPDGGKVIVNMGREGYENFRKMLLWEATDDALDAAAVALSGEQANAEKEWAEAEADWRGMPEQKGGRY